MLCAVEDYRTGSYTYDNDAVTTNLYLGNINPKVGFFCLAIEVSLTFISLCCSKYVLTLFMFSFSWISWKFLSDSVEQWHTFM